MYPSEIVLPMKEELTENGFLEMTTPNEVEETLNKPGTTLVMVNSVCGCSAGTARPGVLMAVANSSKNLTSLLPALRALILKRCKKCVSACCLTRLLHPPLHCSKTGN